MRGLELWVVVWKATGTPALHHDTYTRMRDLVPTFLNEEQARGWLKRYPGLPQTAREMDVVKVACSECRGRGHVDRECHDPQCGDSTWDHECTTGVDPCPTCRRAETGS